MAVKLFFGLPGCGKTTLLAAFALKGSRSFRYKHVYSNVPCSIPGVTLIDNKCIGKYNLRDCLILIDEGTLFADSRHHKEFPKHVCEYFMLHRHYNADIVIFTQGWDTLDKRIRQITDRVYYVYKTPIMGLWWTRYYRIPYGIIIPDPKKDSGSTKLGEIIQGYCKPNLLIRIFAHRLFRPRYYRYFDSWDRPELPPLPSKYLPYKKPVKEDNNRFDLQTAARWLSGQGLASKFNRALDCSLGRIKARLAVLKGQSPSPAADRCKDPWEAPPCSEAAALADPPSLVEPEAAAGSGMRSYG